ncbi:non-ribosomal peptide synthetase [Streptomyces paromomycinus]|uniref:Putative peptide synthetase MbtE n=1 Tax=Streptomyces paromomycinus TaxID=92743 RepID=A0A401WEN6_STREY|nr:non-ribosomal peptide synthetase [Streptomyces paromomycinus]GCD47806.1 putative peptide synthetase MbtE [Streptomyces paromomycinus]
MDPSTTAGVTTGQPAGTGVRTRFTTGTGAPRAAGNITEQYLARYEKAAAGVSDPAALLPVTGAQRRFLLARRLAPGGRPDVVPLFFAFPRGTIDLERLRAAAGHLAATHPALRTRPDVLRGAPVQRLGAPEAQVNRVTPRPGESAAAALRRTLLAWSAEGPPLRLFLADAEADTDAEADGSGTHTDGTTGPVEILALALDHAVCDEQSLGRISADLGEAYGHGLGPGDVPQDRAAVEVAGYREAVRLQLDAEKRASGPDALAYWARRIAPALAGSGAHAALGQSAARQTSAPAAPRPTGALQARLPVRGGDGRATAFPVLLGACGSVARALAEAGAPGRTPLLGYPWGGRPAAAPPVLGCFLNTVVHPAFAGGPDDLTTTWWDDLDHADTPFDEVVRAARTATVPWTGQLDGLLTFEDLHRRPPLELDGVAGREVHIDGRPLQAPFAVSVSYGTDLLVRLAWDRDAFPDGLARDAFAALTAELSGGPAELSGEPAEPSGRPRTASATPVA